MSYIKNGLNITRHIEPTFTADQWDLYTRSKDCDHVAKELNSTLADCFNSGKEASETFQTMWLVMKKYADYGACDSEPCHMLDKVMMVLYPDWK